MATDSKGQMNYLNVDLMINLRNLDLKAGDTVAVYWREDDNHVLQVSPHEVQAVDDYSVLVGGSLFALSNGRRLSIGKDAYIGVWNDGAKKRYEYLRKEKPDAPASW